MEPSTVVSLVASVEPLSTVDSVETDDLGEDSSVEPDTLTAVGSDTGELESVAPDSVVSSVVLKAVSSVDPVSSLVHSSVEKVESVVPKPEPSVNNVSERVNFYIKHLILCSYLTLTYYYLLSHLQIQFQ